MDRQQLITAITAALTKAKVVELTQQVATDQLSVSDLLDLCFYTANPAVAFRAAWLLEYAATHNPPHFSPFFREFARRFAEQQHSSCQRHFTNILLRFTAAKASQARQNEFAALPNREQLVEMLFEWLIRPGAPIAVKANSMEILCNLRHQFPWISAELKEQIIHELRTGSAGIQSRGRKILGILSAEGD